MINKTSVLLNRFNLFKKCISILLPSSVIVLTAFVEPSIPQEVKGAGTSKIFLIKDLSSDNKLTVNVYKADSNPIEIIDLSGIDITGEGKSYLAGSYFGDTTPNFKLILLRKGYASIKLGSTALESERKEQEYAKSFKIGMWVDKPQPTKKNDEFDWFNFGKFAVIGLISLITFFGFKTTVDFLIQWIKRRPVDLVMLGLGSVGKSWIIARLINPDISETELQNILITNVANKMTVAKIAVGRHDVIPTYVDTAGGQPGGQVDAMLSKKNQSIWIIVLSTTDQSGVNFDSQDSEKINNSHLEKQLGSLILPLGLLESSFCKKPEMVILCIGKFDIFSDDPPGTKNARLAEEKLKNLFNKHTSQIKNACEKKGVKFVLILCSALKKDWKTEQIESCIKTALYPK
jgi:hypothetical protein